MTIKLTTIDEVHNLPDNSILLVCEYSESFTTEQSSWRYDARTVYVNNVNPDDSPSAKLNSIKQWREDNATHIGSSFILNSRFISSS